MLHIIIASVAVNFILILIGRFIAIRLGKKYEARNDFMCNKHYNKKSERMYIDNDGLHDKSNFSDEILNNKQ